jgi:hypothetical protein
MGFAPGAPYQGSVLDLLETLSGPQTSRRLSSPLTQNPGSAPGCLNSVQASYFERFHWPILNFWTLQTVEHDGNGTQNSMLRGL